MEYDDLHDKFVNLIVIIISFIVIAVLIVAFASATLHPTPGAGEPIPKDSPGPKSPRNASKPPQKSPLQRLASLDSICPHTDYESACRKSLASVKGTARYYMVAAINIGIEQMIEAKREARILVNHPRIKDDYEEINDCIELMSLGELDLKTAVLTASNESLICDQPTDIKNSLNAVLAYREACLDGLKDWRIRSEIENAYEEPTQTVANALAIFDQYYESSSEVPTVDKSRVLRVYSGWISPGNRKLLQKSRVQPDPVVAGDGSGEFRTTGEAAEAYKLNGNGRYVIYVKAGM